MRLLCNTLTKGSTGALIMDLSHSWNFPGFLVKKGLFMSAISYEQEERVY